jgi:hypothetical protein
MSFVARTSASAGKVGAGMPPAAAPFMEDDNDKKGGKHETKRDLEAELDELRAELASARAALPLTLVPSNGGGPGEEIRQTWSLAEQEAENAKAARRK